MNGNNTVYQGKHHKFKKGKYIGKGGNGIVYDAEILCIKSDEKYVIKILNIGKWHKDGQAKSERYERFKREIKTTVELQDDVAGIMRIIDFYCPDEIPNDKDVWYVMYKAEKFNEFFQNNNYTLIEKMNWILRLGVIIQALHLRDYSHRDIKTDNLLFYNGELMLSDFGLIFNIVEKRITQQGERVGPYYIGPPELECEDINISDFRPADIYLFAKVIWEILKEDYIGFRGQYKRDNKQFYLNPKEFGDVTLEPMHELLENATEFDVDKRIDINKCIELIKNQIEIISSPKSPNNIKFNNYRFLELENEIRNFNEPNERIYNEFKIIFKILNKLIDVCNIVIVGPEETIYADSIEIWKNEKAILFSGRINSYLCYPDLIKYTKEKHYFDLKIKNVIKSEINEDFITYKESKQQLWGNINAKIFLNESLTIRFKMNQNNSL
ncbi:putative Non-specific serine/threonine protein kinase [Clostridium neonatale]|uniref:protein kinase domain-containing protein n=1 Tax=Clostridium neonatale TaxID=137838 RepID=UPI00291B6B4A|nr:putative Non-specific serine/threonine protein kinase [Clostridium neonatale]